MRLQWLTPRQSEVLKIILCLLCAVLAANQFITASMMAEKNTNKIEYVETADLPSLESGRKIKSKLGKSDISFLGMLGNNTYSYHMYITDDDKILTVRTEEGSGFDQAMKKAPTEAGSGFTRKSKNPAAVEESGSSDGQSAPNEVSQEEQPEFEYEFIANTVTMLSGEEYIFDNTLVANNFFHKNNLQKSHDNSLYIPVVLQVSGAPEKYSQTLIVMTFIGGIFFLFCILFIARSTIKDIIFMVKEKKGKAPEYVPEYKKEDLEFELEGFYEGVEDGSKEGDFYINTEYNIRKQGTSLETRMREKEMQKRAEAAEQTDTPEQKTEKPWISDDFFYSSGTNDEGNFFVESGDDDQTYKRY